MTYTESTSDGHMLSDQALRVYRRVLHQEPVAPDAPGVSTAVELGVLVPDPTSPGVYRAVEPGRAVPALMYALLSRIQDHAASLRRLPALHDELMEVYRDARGGQEADIEHLHGNAMINSRLEEVIDTAEFELCTAQPGGPRTRETLERSLRRDTDALDRGVEMRTLYHATARFSTHTQEWVKTMSDRGGEIRTLDQPFLRMIIVDRRSAFIQDLLDRGHEEERSWAHLVRDAALCAFLLEIFERDWTHGDRWHGTAVEAGHVTTRLQRSILRLLADGKTLPQAAVQVGMSVRTLQKHLEELRARVPGLSKGSLPQLTYWWATCPDRHLD